MYVLIHVILTKDVIIKISNCNDAVTIDYGNPIYVGEHEEKVESMGMNLLKISAIITMEKMNSMIIKMNFNKYFLSGGVLSHLARDILYLS
jgi:hypothetical protein